MIGNEGLIYFVFCSICTISEALPRKYFRSKIKINAYLFCTLLAYLYLCTQNMGTIGK